MYSEVKICINISYNYNSYCAYDYRSTQSWKGFLWTSCEKIAHILNVTKRLRFPLSRAESTNHRGDRKCRPISQPFFCNQSETVENYSDQTVILLL